MSVMDPGFHRGRRQLPKGVRQPIAETRMKMKEFRPRGGARVSSAHALDPPMHVTVSKTKSALSETYRLYSAACNCRR